MYVSCELNGSSNVCMYLCLKSHQQPYRDGPQLKVSSKRLVKPGMEPATTGLQGEWFIQYTTAATEIVFYSAMLVM